MLTVKQAYDALKKKFPELKIVSGANYDSAHYIFMAVRPGEEDEVFDPYFGVDKNTGDVTGFNPSGDLDAFFEAYEQRPLNLEWVNDE